MTRWIRWSYVLPRLVLLAAIVAALELGTGIAVRQAIIATGQRIVGAKVEVGSSAASMLRTEVALREIRVANPRRPLENLFEADRLELDFELDALLRKKAVAREGVLRGLRFVTPRSSSGELAGQTQDEEPSNSGWLAGRAQLKAERWFADISSRFSQDLIADFQSVRLAEELIQSWPQRYQSLEERAGQLKMRSRRLQKDVKHSQTNPLRNVKFLERLPGELRGLVESLQSLEAELAALPDALNTDRMAIHQARQHDEQLLREKFAVDAIDSATLTAYFLQDQIAAPVASALRWIHWARRSIADNFTEPKPVRQRGIEVLFPGCERRPNFLVRSLQLQGTARLAGQPVELSGTLTDLTSEPAIHGEPMRLDLVTTGSLPLQLKAVIDRTGDAARDELLVDCRGILLPQFSLGQSERLGLSFAPSTAAVNLSVLIAGDEISGDIQLIQDSVQITPTVASELAAWQLDQALMESLGKLKSIATRISLSGTLEDPAWAIWSNLGPAVAEALDFALARAVQSATEQLLARSNRQLQEKLVELDQLVARRSAEILPQLEGPREQLTKLVESYTGGRGLSLEQLGRRLPAESLFR